MRRVSLRRGLNVEFVFCLLSHRHAVHSAQLLSDGEDVQQGLGRMLPNTVSSVDHGLTAMT